MATSTASRKRPLETSQHDRQPPTAEQLSSKAARRSLFKQAPQRTTAPPASDEAPHDPWAAERREQDLLDKIQAIPICQRRAMCSSCAHHSAFHRCCQERPLPPHLLPLVTPLPADDEEERQVTAKDMMEDYFHELERRILAQVGPKTALVAANGS